MLTEPSNLADDDAPEWAHRLLNVREFAYICGESPSTVYRKINAGIYPPLVHFGSSSRVPGWEAWRTFKRHMAERDHAGALPTDDDAAAPDSRAIALVPAANPGSPG